jgi:chromosome segregation ATPase
MGETNRAKRTKAGPARSRVHAAAETAARAGRALAGGVAEPGAKASPRRQGSPEAEIRALKRALTEADARLRAAEVRFARTQARLVGHHERETEVLEAQLTKLVQEIGAAKHIVDRAQAREGEMRVLEERLAELRTRESAWGEERVSLLAEIDRLRPSERAVAAQAPPEEAKPRAVAAAAGGGGRAKTAGGAAAAKERS